MGLAIGSTPFALPASQSLAAGDVLIYDGRSTGVFDPLAGLTLTDSQGGGTWTLGFDRSGNATFAARDVVFPLSPSDGCLVEKGGSGRGLWLGLRDGGTVFRARAGDGVALSASSDGAAILDITDFPRDGQPHDVVWDVQPAAPGRIRLWIDGTFKGEAITTTGDSLEAGQWEGGGGGGYGDGTGSNVSGEPSNGWPAAYGILEGYENQLVAA